MLSRPGKTAPRLIQDLLTYDPRYEERAGRNILTDPPPQYDEDKPPQPAVYHRNCRHNFMTKQDQSVLPDPAALPDYSTIYKISSFCLNCRWHLDLLVDFRDDGTKNAPCPSEGYALHHFLYQAEDDAPQDVFGRHNVPKTYNFKCSAERCPVEVRIRLRPPRVTEEYKKLMTDRLLLRRRLDRAKEIDPDRVKEDIPARPIEGLVFLSTYLRDSLVPKKGKTRIPLLNRKFLKTFGKDCDGMLQAFGFTCGIEEEENGSQTVCWYLPKPAPLGDPLDDDSLRFIIDDAMHELGALISAIPEADKTGSNIVPFHPQPSVREIERALSCLDYQKKSMTRAEARSTNAEEDHPHYAGLGTVGDFSDALVLFSWTRQTVVDPLNANYYFECLQGIAVGRKSEMLEEQVQMLASQGQTNRKDVVKAYRYFGIDPAHTSVLSDEIIIGQFRSRLQDISSAMEEETRNNLRVIGVARKSALILQEASNAIETYAQALSWLDLGADQPDDFVQTMYTIRVNDNAANKDIALKAVEIIARERRSDRLMNFLQTGNMGASSEMDLAEAYVVLNIMDRTASIDFAVLESMVADASKDNPEDAAKYRKAYQVIRQDKERNGNLGPSTDDTVDLVKYPLEKWPVGCKNIGNTCYLNSVLQFLFTVSPLREMVLHFNDYKQELTPEALEHKKVGREKVTKEKVERAQEFVHELRKLFYLMITAPSSYVTPEHKLVYLALVKDSTLPSNAAKGSSNSNAPAKGLGEIAGVPVMGPIPNPSMASGSEPEADNSENMLVESNVSALDRDKDDKASDTSSTMVHTDDVAVVDSNEENKVETDAKLEPPSRPPPVPPRPRAATIPSSQGATDMKTLESVAQQQDAAEILNNIFDLLSCAMQGVGIMEDGEQMDMIKEMFFSEVATTKQTKDDNKTLTALQDNILVSAERNCPLYATLDNEFGLKELETEPGKSSRKFELIKRHPPILIINVRRIGFDDVSKISKKIEHHIDLPSTLYMDRYLEETEESPEANLTARREKQWELKQELQSLERRKAQLSSQKDDLKLSLAEVVNNTADYIGDLQKANDEVLVDLDDDPLPTFPTLPDELRQKATELGKELTSIESREKEIDTEVNSLFSDLKSHPYHLHAIFMHRGGAAGGHYWIFIYDFQNNVWRKYNDAKVEEVTNLKDIFEQEKTRPAATSTSIVYVQRDRVAEMTKAVLRKPAKPPAPTGDAGQDTEMKDASDTDEFKHVEVLEGIPE